MNSSRPRADETRAEAFQSIVSIRRRSDRDGNRRRRNQPRAARCATRRMRARSAFAGERAETSVPTRTRHDPGAKVSSGPSPSDPGRGATSRHRSRSCSTAACPADFRVSREERRREDERGGRARARRAARRPRARRSRGRGAAPRRARRVRARGCRAPRRRSRRRRARGSRARARRSSAGGASSM